MKKQVLVRLALLLFAVGCVLPAVAQNFDETKWGKNTAGVELRAVEVSRQPSTSGTVLTYNLIGTGFPANEKYSVWGWVVGRKPEKEIEGVSFDSKGMVVCSGKPGFCTGKSPNDAINIQTTAVLAEPKRFAVLSDDGKVGAFAEAIPFPIEATDKNCKVAIVRESPMSEVVQVRATGFVPYEMLNVTGHVGEQEQHHSPTASPEGTWGAVIGTKAPGETSGVATIKVTGQQCSVTVSFKWGEDSTDAQ